MKKISRRSFLKVTAISAAALGLSACTVGGSTPASKAASSAGSAAASSAAEPVSGESSLKGQNVRVVIGSTSTSGDSYMIADLVTRYLSQEMGFNGKVDSQSAGGAYRKRNQVPHPRLDGTLSGRLL